MAVRPEKTARPLVDTARAAVYWQGGDPRWQPVGVAPLTTTERADVCIVGGGFTGLWTAIAIKRLAPETDVVIVEREYCGAGASGRNGGWVNGWDDALPKLVAHFGRDAALWLLDASQRGLDDIR
ncbi:MAG: FAD-dependent oxidoreductase, partial [Thermoleophilia bacterium]|nr:FAD-dependent oxidoreductase [Thermoleophilia bacterium]